MKQTISRIPARILALTAGLLLAVGAFAQQITVNGLVKDTSGWEIIGAHVRVVGQDGGAVTDLDGKFSISAKQGAQIEISYIGYKTAMVAARPFLAVVLEEDSKVMEDVVVIGYGQAKKSDVTGSVVAIKPDEKNHGMQVSVQDMLQGKVAGVNVNNYSGAPGEGAQIRIRGGASLNASNDPLIVIDGLAMDNNATKGMSNPLSLVNPNDIETFTILKDASATAIYGSRGSNGVILITTKKGAKGQGPKVSYNGNVSVSMISKKLDVMNATDYVNTIKSMYGENSDAYRGLGWKEFNADGTPNFAAGTYDTDWQNEIYRNGISHDHNLTVTGGVGNEKWNMPYRLSFGYTQQNGILKGSDYNRITGGLSLNPSLFKDHLNINANAKFAHSMTTPGGTGAIGAAISMDPTRPVKSDDPKYTNWGGYYQWVVPSSDYDPTFPYSRNYDAPTNPVELIDHYNFDKSSTVVLGNIDFDYKIHGFEDLRLHASFAGEYANGGEYTHPTSRQTTYGFYYGNQGTNKEKKYNLTTSAYIQYYKDWSDKHHFDIMGGYEYSRTKYWGDQYFWNTYPMTNEGYYDDEKTQPKKGTINSETKGEWAGQMVLVSWYGRANYSYKNRYLFTGTVRYDGSSRFADGHRWGLFPSAAFAWRISEESFLKNVNSVNDFKLRLGWGKTGQQDTGKEYYTPIYKKSTSQFYTYPVGPNNPGILYQPSVYNNDLTWETTTTYNAGIDFGMWNNRFTINVDAYYRKTTDLLCTPTIPTGQNFDNAVMLNAGTLTNTGVEVAISGKPVATKDWLLDLGVNVAYNKNKITELYGGKDVITAGMQVGTNEAITFHKVGLPANSFWVYQQVYDESGRPVMGAYVDRNADGVIDENDRYYYKNIAAPVTGGFYLKLQWKNFDIGTNFRYSIGNYVYNALEGGKANTAVLCNPKGYYENNTLSNVAMGWTSYNYSLSDHFVHNASFLKCDNITIGYSFDNLFKGQNYHGISGRIYASCSNVFTVTKYNGLDPEQVSGKEYDMYPRSRTFLFGLNLNF
ncbi:MAG: TonB-dependent receptor [Bacteroidaceae bacterium]|nr:TonB-dependent receptor [Bacteroidaceae bacterium]